jgi:D-alanine-D-alanine ligase
LADVAFLALHGDMGENGQLQATLDVFDVTYTGSGYIGSLLAMNKDIAKKLMRESGILTPDWINFNDFGNQAKIDEAISKIGFHCIVKPCSCGSSVGVSIVNDREQLCSALTLAEKYESSILVESFVHGREFSVGILGDKALPPIEIIPKSGFDDYKNKYQSGMTEEICPAELTTEQDRILRECALRSHRCLGLGSYSRIDFILDSESGDFVFLEANALPGMTPTSLLPQEARADGIEYGQLCEIIAESAKKESVSH